MFGARVVEAVVSISSKTDSKSYACPFETAKIAQTLKSSDSQTGDPTGIGTGGESIWGGEFEDELHPRLRHDRPYTLRESIQLNVNRVFTELTIRKVNPVMAVP